MALFNKVVAGLQRLFPASGMGRHSPSELSDNVQLVHPFPSQAADLQSSSRVSFTSSTVVTPVLTIAPAVGEDPAAGTPSINAQVFDEWMLMHIGHTAAAGVVNRLRLSLLDPTGAAILLGIWNFDSNVTPFLPGYNAGVFVNGAFASPTQLMFPMRPVLVPPGWSLQVVGDTQAVAYNITLAGQVARRALADVPLWR
jgi:hypothetical protein